MKKIQVNLIMKPFFKSEQELFGLPMSEILRKTIKDAKIAEYGDKLSDGAEYIAEIPEGMVLVSDALLKELSAIAAEKGAVRFGEAILYKKGSEKNNAAVLPDRQDFLCVKDCADIATAYAVLKERIVKKHQKNGVVILDPATTYIDFGVEIDEGVVIHPSVKLVGKCKIEFGVVIYSFSELVDTEIGHKTDVRSSFLTGTKVGSHSTVGPFACTRIGTVIGSNCRIGDYVEVKNSTLGNGVKVAHLAYIGDSTVGDRCNVGCGTVFANYDGQKKSRCVIGEEVFIGANTNLVAPVTVGSNAFIAAGSTITDDIPEHAMSIARERQVIKPNWKRP